MAAAQQQQLGAHPPVPEAGAGAAESQGEGAWQALPRAIRSGAAGDVLGHSGGSGRAAQHTSLRSTSRRGACGKFTDEASSAGHVLLRRMVKLHYNWKYKFVRPNVEEVCARHKIKHAQGGARQVAAPAPAAEVAAPSGGGASD